MSKIKHVVIVPDGNRRWAKQRGLKSWEGHFAAKKRVVEIIRAMDAFGIDNLTIWAFSTENWKRTDKGITVLMDLLKDSIIELGEELIQRGVKFKHIGRKDRLSPGMAKILMALEEKTAGFEGKMVAVALDYGGRDEILRTVNKIIAQKDVLLDGGKITEEIFSAALDTGGLPDPDLIIRTSGEYRLSGIFPWQGVYAELYFAEVYFPDFTVEMLGQAIEEFHSRKRRFGA